MSIKVLTSEAMLSTVNGLGMRQCWGPRIVCEAFLESTKDGEISRAPDPVEMIHGDMSWFNASGIIQAVGVMVQRAPRSVVSTSPVTVIIQDATSFAVGFHPEADYPSLERDYMGGKVMLDTPETAPEDMLFGRFFLDTDASESWVHVGDVSPGEAIHVRYLCAVQTPGGWVQPSEFDVRYEAFARWARLQALAWPWVAP